VYFFEDEAAPPSCGVGDVFEVSAFREMGLPSWEGLVSLVWRAVSRRVFFCWGVLEKGEETGGEGSYWRHFVCLLRLLREDFGQDEQKRVRGKWKNILATGQ